MTLLPEEIHYCDDLMKFTMELTNRVLVSEQLWWTLTYQMLLDTINHTQLLNDISSTPPPN